MTNLTKCRTQANINISTQSREWRVCAVAFCLFVFFFFWGNKKKLIYIRLKIKNQVFSLGNWLFLDVVSDSFPPAHTCQLSDWQTHTCTHTLSDSDTSAYIHCKPVLNNTLKKITIQHPLTFFFFLPPRGKELEMCVCVCLSTFYFHSTFITLTSNLTRN